MNNDLILGLILLIVAVDLLHDLISKRKQREFIRNEADRIGNYTRMAKQDIIGSNSYGSFGRAKYDVSILGLMNLISDRIGQVKTSEADEERDDQKDKRQTRKLKKHEKFFSNIGNKGNVDES